MLLWRVLSSTHYDKVCFLSGVPILYFVGRNDTFLIERNSLKYQDPDAMNVPLLKELAKGACSPFRHLTRSVTG